MQSSDHQYLSKLDHLRAFAAFQVFCWHFLHLDGQAYHKGVFPAFGVLTQGHTGVALFMCISGYIFTHLTNGMQVSIPKFWVNRFLRLAPLMMFWFLFGTAFSEQISPLRYFSFTWFYNNAYSISAMNGYWSIYIELGYYLMFPLLLFAIRRFSPWALIVPLLVVFTFRAYSCNEDSCSMQNLSYDTLWGRADQFLWGTAAFYIERYILRKCTHPQRLLRGIGAIAFVAFLTFYGWFNAVGGFSDYSGFIRGNSLWLYMPSIEAICYSAMIMGYLHCPIPKIISRALSKIGTYSYSIYLGHPHFIHMIFTFISVHFGMPENLGSRLVITSLIAFPTMLAISALTYKCIETPFLRLRLRYLKPLEIR